MNVSMNKTFWDYFKVNFHWFLTVNLTHSFVFLHLLSFFASDFYSKLIYSSFLISISSFLGIWATVLIMQLIRYCVVTPYKPRVAPTTSAKPVEPTNVESIRRMISNQRMLYNSAVDMDIMNDLRRQREQEEISARINYGGESYASYMRRVTEQLNMQQLNMQQLSNDTFRLYAGQYNRPNPVIFPQDYIDSLNTSLNTLKSLESKKNVDLEFID